MPDIHPAIDEILGHVARLAAGQNTLANVLASETANLLPASTSAAASVAADTAKLVADLAALGVRL